MTPAAPLWVREAEVVEVLDLESAMRALEDALAIEARGGVVPLAKTHAAFGDGDSLHALGAVLGDPGGDGAPGALAGTKTWAHTHGGATPLLVLWHATDGSLAAVIEAFALGQLRTSGVSGVATARLAAADADELAIVGSGKQSLAQVAAVAAVRRLRGVRVYSPTPAHRERLAARIAGELGIAARAAATLADCLRDAPLVTAATRARAPFLEAALVARGAHVNAIGAIAPDRAEIAPDLLPRVTLAVADAPAEAVRLTRELAAAPWPLHALCDLVAGRIRRPPAPDVTLFKAMGTGVADLALGRAVLGRVRARGLGRPLAPPERAAPRLLTAAARGDKPVPGGDA